jgi:uncharacterized alpha-E superfamily protein
MRGNGVARAAASASLQEGKVPGDKMLGRTANHLFWMSRYIERAENMARLLEVGYRIALLPGQSHGHDEEWRSTLRSAGCEPGYLTKYGAYDTSKVVNFMLFDAENPSSVYSCLAAARRNARAQRTALTREMWESLNGAWITFAAIDPTHLASDKLPPLFDWIKELSALFRGALLNTILRNDTFYFNQLGAFLERADNTARILDVKYYVLLPHNELVGGEIDSVQWAAILRSVSAHRSYRWVYRDSYKPWRIADYLILNRQMPRSLCSCYEEIMQALVDLDHYYGTHSGPQEFAGETLRQLADGDMNAIFQSGLHEFLAEFIARNNRLGSEISSTYHFVEETGSC